MLDIRIFEAIIVASVSLAAVSGVVWTAADLLSDWGEKVVKTVNVMTKRCKDED